MKILHEWHFHNRVCRVVESDPGIVHFEEATRTTGDPSIMLFNYTPTPMGAANEIIQLSMALAEANVINRELSSAIQRWQEERNFRDKEIEELRAELADWHESAERAAGESCGDEQHCTCVGALRARVKELEGMVPRWTKASSDECRQLCIDGWAFVSGTRAMDGRCLMVPPIPLPEGK